LGVGGDIEEVVSHEGDRNLVDRDWLFSSHEGYVGVLQSQIFS